jgi:DNA-binding transcriptional MerR regulator
MAKFMAVPTLERGIPSRVIYDTLGISNQLLSQWVKTDIVRPSIRRGRKGDVRTCGALWSFYDLLDIKTIKGLRRAGLSMQKARTVIGWLREHGYTLHSTNLATNGENVWINLDDVTVEIVKVTDQLIFLDWRPIVEECISILESRGVDVR